MTNRDTFLNLQAQTSQSPYLIEVDKAEGIYIWDKAGKRYYDMIAGVAVNNIGHRHPAVIAAIQAQIDKHLHVMVYGEYVQDSQVALANNLASILPHSLSCSYIVNSGTEAIEAALKLAKRVTGRHHLVGCNKSYHGSTHGSMSISGNEVKKAKFRPLLPAINFIDFNDIDSLHWITEKTAGVLIEPVQGDAGMRVPDPNFLKALRAKCDEVGALLIFDEVQVGLGRVGSMFAFEQYDVIPDVLVLGKALGGGMPIGAMLSSYENMHELTYDPMLGHITTFGGHPVVCAAANACIDVLKSEPWMEEVEAKGELLETIVNAHPDVIEIRRKGLFFAIEMGSFDRVKAVVDKCLEKGLIGFWFLSCPTAFRLSPPISITKEEMEAAANIILRAIEETA
ncbi:aspartate aminotransferase family protein [Putridiphycobacter roseus]|uniref:Aspartate aminotransferase family protein n=1 Tax=Putridiphycobacter roseus TaxID=2219161 RepID=A0A2W1NDB0_9FLAO|nr:aspartate aminotransferase family protein [Putridiphycobacter roseus]PZE16066.1 aspartate aminotransferase family protein [Putridiphycobacter roseus]